MGRKGTTAATILAAMLALALASPAAAVRPSEKSPPPRGGSVDLPSISVVVSAPAVVVEVEPVTDAAAWSDVQVAAGAYEAAAWSDVLATDEALESAAWSDSSLVE